MPRPLLPRRRQPPPCILHRLAVPRCLQPVQLSLLTLLLLRPGTLLLGLQLLVLQEDLPGTHLRLTLLQRGGGMRIRLTHLCT